MSYILDPDEYTDNDAAPKSAQSEQTDRVTGEYHYKNGYTQRIYSDAHYVREDENTVPPRYYTPPEKPQKEVREPKENKNSGLVKLICACLICAILGGIGGAALVGKSVNDRIAKLEESITEEEAAPVLNSITDGKAIQGSSTNAVGDVLTAAAIYDTACEQVVGITTDVTIRNYFGMTSSSAVTGSGFIVSSDGYIMTNYHVIEYAYEDDLEVTVMLHDESRYTAQIVGVEPENDVAVLKIDAEGLNPAVLGDSDALQVGDTVYAVGNPLGELEFSMTTGHVSAKDRAISTDNSSSSIRMFQIDAAVNSGNSGGPVYNDQGEVVGIVTAKYSSTGVEGIGFAIPINDAAAIANDLITKGYVTGKAYLGVSINTNYNSMYSQYYGWPLGAYVEEVTPGSCAEAAGIEAGDIITKVDGDEITSYEDLKAAIRRHSAGDTVEIEVYRADESRIVTVTFDENTPEQTTAQTDNR